MKSATREGLGIMTIKTSKPLLIAQAVGVYILSLLTFYGLHGLRGITTQLYLIFAISLYLIVFLCYFREWRTFIVIAVHIFVNNLAFFTSIVLMRERELTPAMAIDAISNRHGSTMSWLLIYGGIFVVLFIFVGAYSWFTAHNDSDGDPLLLPQQERDLERIKNYLGYLDIVGVCSAWGTGKTFLLSTLEKREKKKHARDRSYEFIHVDLLASQLDELQTIILYEIDKILLRYGRISKRSKKFKDLLGRSGPWSRLTPVIFTDDVSFSNAVRDMGKEIGGIKKTVVIVYEDIDRISNPRTIRKIFGISGTLASKHIKIVYQYDKGMLEKRFKREELEKYIPHTVNLSPISFGGALEQFCANDNEISKILGPRGTYPQALDFIKNPNELIFVFGPDEDHDRISADIVLPHVSMRVIRHFLLETARVISDNPELINNIRTIAATLMVKHFYDDINAIFESHDQSRFCLLDKLSFKEPGNNVPYTASTIIDNYQKGAQTRDDVMGLLNSPINGREREVLCLFNHNSYTLIPRSSRVNPDECNAKKDAIISRLLFSGEHDNILADGFLENVAKNPIGESRTYSYMRHWTSFRDTHRQYMYDPENPHASVFRAFFLTNDNVSDWFKLIDFHHNLTRINPEYIKINRAMMDIMNWCRIDTSFKDVYIKVISWFAETNIDSRFDWRNKDYLDFLHQFMVVLADRAYVGYSVENSAINILHADIQHLTASAIVGALELTQTEIRRVQNHIPNFTNMNAFIAKNIEILSKK